MTTFCFGLIFNFLSAIFQFLSRRFFSGLCFSTIRLFPTGTQVVADLQTNLNEDFGPQFQQAKVKNSMNPTSDELLNTIWCISSPWTFSR